VNEGMLRRPFTKIGVIREDLVLLEKKRQEFLEKQLSELSSDDSSAKIYYENALKECKQFLEDSTFSGEIPITQYERKKFSKTQRTGIETTSTHASISSVSNSESMTREFNTTGSFPASNPTF
jgi:hypothetical protein